MKPQALLYEEGSWFISLNTLFEKEEKKVNKLNIAVKTKISLINLNFQYI